jgi:hypothetical protein
MLDGWGVKCWLACLHGRLRVERQCCYLLGERSNMLVPRLLVCCDHVDRSHQFRGDYCSLVSVTQSAASGRGSCRLSHRRIGFTGVVALVQNVMYVLGDVSLLARCVAYVQRNKFTCIRAVDKSLEDKPSLIWDGIPTLELPCLDEDP